MHIQGPDVEIYIYESQPEVYVSSLSLPRGSQQSTGVTKGLAERILAQTLKLHLLRGNELDPFVT